MTFKILNEKENPLFKRKEIGGSVEAEVTPSYADAVKLISEKIKTPAENIKITNVLGKFGSKTFTINAYIYNSKKDRDAAEGEVVKEEKEVGPEQLPSPEQPATESLDNKSSKSSEASETKTE